MKIVLMVLLLIVFSGCGDRKPEKTHNEIASEQCLKLGGVPVYGGGGWNPDAVTDCKFNR